jgi:hypothetical protein
MKLYLISNVKRYTGAVKVMYDINAVLQSIDFSETNMPPADRAKMLPLISAVECSVAEGFKSADTVIVQGDYEVSFEDFWREYPHKRNRFLAEKVWGKMKKSEQVEAFISATNYRKFLERNSWQNPKIADRWLKEQQYLNDWKQL